ncbi:MAG: hypothetical protein ABEJ26_09690 [Halosimplex sp.]
MRGTRDAFVRATGVVGPDIGATTAFGLRLLARALFANGLGAVTATPFVGAALETARSG